jgi:hypothetical protein
VAEALRRELLREGQVFYVHNRVATIEKVAAELRALVPEARVVVAHGQMDEGALEKVILDFWEGAYDVLVCTTIIESGIDMPTVNTLVVDRADRLGLGQLHQLRGRVGRGGHNGPTPTCCSRPTRPSPRRRTSGCAPSASTPSWDRGSRSPCGTWRSAAPATCSAATSRATSPRWVRPVRADGGRSGGRAAHGGDGARVREITMSSVRAGRIRAYRWRACFPLGWRRARRSGCVASCPERSTVKTWLSSSFRSGRANFRRTWCANCSKS